MSASTIKAKARRAKKAVSLRRPVTLVETTWKTIVTHSVTYMIMGLLASTLFDYATLFEQSMLNVMMRPLNDPWVMAGPLLQPLRGLLFGLVFYLLRERFFDKTDGWLVMWVTLVILGIFSTFGPSPGSFEGLIYTILPLSIHIGGLPEVLLQSLALALILFYWIRHPGQKWVSWLMVSVFVILMALPALGLIVS